MCHLLHRLHPLVVVGLGPELWAPDLLHQEVREGVELVHCVNRPTPMVSAVTASTAVQMSTSIDMQIAQLASLTNKKTCWDSRVEAGVHRRGRSLSRRQDLFGVPAAVSEAQALQGVWLWPVLFPILSRRTYFNTRSPADMQINPTTG